MSILTQELDSGLGHHPLKCVSDVLCCCVVDIVAVDTVLCLTVVVCRRALVVHWSIRVVLVTILFPLSIQVVVVVSVVETEVVQSFLERICGVGLLQCRWEKLMCVDDSFVEAGVVQSFPEEICELGFQRP